MRIFKSRYSCFWAFVFLFFSSVENIRAQSEIDLYLKSTEFVEHKNEAIQIHNDIILGKIDSPLLQSLMSDSVDGKPNKNRKEVMSLINSEEFRHHSARIDTSFVVGAKPKNITSYRFRDIFYLGNNQFKQYLIQISFQWDPKTRETKHRFLSARDYVIPSRKVWNDKIWFDASIYNGLED